MILKKKLTYLEQQELAINVLCAINTHLFEKFLLNLTNKAQLCRKYADLFAAALVHIVSPMMSFSLQAKHFLIYCLLFY